MQEWEQIRRAQKGDRNSMEELLQRNYSILKGYLLKATLDPELAADLTQETMVKAICRIGQFKGQSKFSTWLISIGSNLYRDYLRKHRHLVVTDDLDQMVGESGAGSLRCEIDELLAALPQEKRMVLILKHYFGYTYAEISEILHCPVGTVKSRMYYCMEFLHQQWEGGKRR